MKKTIIILILMFVLTGCSEKRSDLDITGEKSSEDQLNSAQVNDVISFGSYEQDNNLENGKEPIEWVVLDKKTDGSIFVVSKYGLDNQPYDSSQNDNITWENSSLRSWLNESFYSDAFKSYEKRQIMTVKNSNNKGNETYDRVFLLSIDEVKKYYADDEYQMHTEEGWEPWSVERLCEPTTYAKSKGAYVDSYYESDPEDYKIYEGKCCWWLRSQGNGYLIAALIGVRGCVVDCPYASDGIIYGAKDGGIDIEKSVVRPAMWINTNQDSNMDGNSDEKQTIRRDVNEDLKNVKTLSNANIGDVVFFGKYEQDNDESNGKEDIAWTVIDKDVDGSLFLISVYALDGKQFNEVDESTSWERCTLRKWLNESFINEALNAEENSLVMQKTIMTENCTTTDKVYVLSREEAEAYFGSDMGSEEFHFNPSRACKATPYAEAKGVSVKDLTDLNFYSQEDIYGKYAEQLSGGCRWWLRSPEAYAINHNQMTSAYAMDVDEVGHVNYYGIAVDYDCVDDWLAVRPVMWVKP